MILSRRPQLIVVLLVLMVSVQKVQAAMSYIPNTMTMGGKCYHTRRKMFIGKEEILQLPKCTIAKCTFLYNKLTLTEETCGKVDPKCLVPGDHSLPYPDCCPKSKCNI